MTYDPSNWLSVSIADLRQRVYSLAARRYLSDRRRYGEFVPRDIESNGGERGDPRPMAVSTIWESGTCFIPYPGYHRMSVTNGFHWAVDIQPGHYNGYGLQFSEDLSIVRGDAPDRIRRQLYPHESECEFPGQQQPHVYVQRTSRFRHGTGAISCWASALRLQTRK